MRRPAFRPLRAITRATTLILVATSLAASAPPRPPSFTSETDWLKLPARWTLGDVSAVDVGADGQVYVLQRPRTLSDADRGRAAPPILVFAPDGTFLRGFGGAGQGYQWPTVEHSLAVDRQEHVWIAGNALAPKGAEDDMILEFDGQGHFLRQIGRQGASGGDGDTGNVHAPGDLFVDSSRHELYVADGYGNRRVIVFDTRSGRFKRMWSAFGAPPPADPAPPPRDKGAPFVPQVGEGPPGFNGVHAVEVSSDGLVYVSDRNNQRIQVFTRAGRYLRQVFVDRNRESAQTTSGIAFSSDTAQRYMYVADWGNSTVLTFERSTLRLLGSFGAPGKGPGQFTAPHLMATDRQGRLYIAEVQGRRVQRLTPVGGVASRRAVR